MEEKKFAYEGIELGGPRHFYRQELIVRFLESSHNKGRVLDAGCGDGCVSLSLAKRGWDVYALDYSLDFLNILKKRMSVSGLSGQINVCHQNLERIDFPDSYFDAVVCGEVLEHIKDDSRILESFNRILNPSGVCVVTVPIVSKHWDVSDDFFGHQRLYSLDNFKNVIEENGFFLEKYLFWGFPLMKIYYRLIYLNWFKRKDKYEHKQKSIVTRIGKSNLVSLIGAKLFRFDEIFGRREWGIGFVALIRKKSDVYTNKTKNR